MRKERKQNAKMRKCTISSSNKQQGKQPKTKLKKANEAHSIMIMMI